MRIVFNAYNLVIGGGLSVGLGVIGSLYKVNGEDEIHVFLPVNKKYKFSSQGLIKIHYLPPILTDYILGRFFINMYLSYKVKKIKPQVIFSLGNYAIPSPFKQLLLLQWPYAVYPENIIWKRMPIIDFFRRKFRLFLFRSNLKYVACLTVQTQVMKDRVNKYIKSIGDIKILESSFQYLSGSVAEKNQEILKLKKSQREKLLLCMSEYYSHKNLEILVEVAAGIKEQKLPYKILITIDPSLRGAAKLVKLIEEKEVKDIILNIGRISAEDSYSIYQSCDALLLPTLLESYGIPYLEAAYSRLPIFTSNLDFARDMNGDAAWYFDPLSAQSILETLEMAFNDPQLLKEKVDRAFEKASKVRSWEEITREYLKIIKSL